MTFWNRPAASIEMAFAPFPIPTCIAFVAIIISLAGCGLITSKSESVQLPDDYGTVRISIPQWEFKYRTTVENDYGSVAETYWPIADGRRRTNLYLASDHELVTVEAGGDTSYFDITKGRAPRMVVHTRPQGMPASQWRVTIAQWSTASEHWRYLGAVAARDGELRFYSPEEMADCIDLYGEGSTTVRPSRHEDSRA